MVCALPALASLHFYLLAAQANPLPASNYSTITIVLLLQCPPRIPLPSVTTDNMAALPPGYAPPVGLLSASM